MAKPFDFGVVDLGVGFPHTSVEQKKATYDFMRPLYKDRETIESMEFPAEYMFKDVPDLVEPDVDPVAWVVEAMDRHGIDLAKVSMSENGLRARREHPDRFVVGLDLRDTNDVMGSVRQIHEAKAEHDIVSVGVFPCGQFPQVPINDPKMYPVYAACVELGLPIFVNAGIVGPRFPSYPQYVEHLDIVCYDFPDLTLVTRHGCEPWEALAVKLMLKWPGLHYCTSAFAPKHYPRAIIDYANTRGADKVMYCGYFPAGISLDRQFAEMVDVPFRDHVWPKFLRENALRVLGIDR